MLGVVHTIGGETLLPHQQHLAADSRVTHKYRLPCICLCIIYDDLLLKSSISLHIFLVVAAAAADTEVFGG